MMHLPSIAVVMPVRNEGLVIEKNLRAVLEQDYPKEKMEVIVVDGISSDQTREAVRALQRDFLNLKLIDNPKKIVAPGLNAAIREARGGIIIRVDGHTKIAPDYIRSCVEELERTGADNVGGNMRAKGDTLFGGAVALATSSPFGIGNARFHYSNKEEWVDTVYLGAWPKRVFDKIGLFDEEMVRNQDDELNYRLLEAGGKILLSPKIKSEYTVRNSARALWSQYFQYGYWKVRVLQKHPKQMQGRQFVPPVFVTALLFCIMLSFIGKPFALLALGGIYMAANFSAALMIASQKGWKYFPALLLSFTILHLSYGAGFLWGLIKFFNRWSLSR